MADFINTFPLPQSLGAILRGETAEWPEEIDLAAIEQHAIGPLLYARAPHPALREQALRAAAAELLRLEDLRALLAAFAENGVRVLIIKGTALAYDVYEAPELRPRADTDLLIAHDDVARVHDLLVRIGYTPRPLSGDRHANRQQAFARSDRFGVEHVYDVHWDIANTPVVREALRFEELFARALYLPRIAPNARAPRLVDALLLACIHRVAHHHDSERLIWLYDIHLLRERMWPAEQEGCWRMVAARRVGAIGERSIELGDHWFARAAHDHALDWLRGDEIALDEPSAVFLDRDRTRGAALAADLKALGWRERLQRLRDLAFPPARFMRTSFPSAPRAALPLLYLYRGARGVLRLLSRVGG